METCGRLKFSNRMIESDVYLKISDLNNFIDLQRWSGTSKKLRVEIGQNYNPARCLPWIRLAYNPGQLNLFFCQFFLSKFKGWSVRQTLNSWHLFNNIHICNQTVIMHVHIPVLTGGKKADWVFKMSRTERTKKHKKIIVYFGSSPPVVYPQSDWKKI